MRRQQRAAAFAPPASAASYRDVLRFEQRLVQNAERLSKQRRKYELFLAGLVVAIVSEGYIVLIAPSIYSLVRYLHAGLLLILVTALVLFFATGIYTEKIARAYKFVPQTNRSLRPFNLYLNTRRPAPWWSFGLFGRAAPRTAMNSTTASASPSPHPSPPTSPERRPTIPLAPLEPASDPAGELIFSNRVDPAFRDGYNAFRSEWKRQKKERQHGHSPSASASGITLPGGMKELNSLPTTPSRSREGPASRTSPPTSSRGKSRSPSPLAVPRIRSRSGASSPSTTDEESGPPSPAPHEVHEGDTIRKHREEVHFVRQDSFTNR